MGREKEGRTSEERETPVYIMYAQPVMIRGFPTDNEERCCECVERLYIISLAGGLKNEGVGKDIQSELYSQTAPMVAAAMKSRIDDLDPKDRCRISARASYLLPSSPSQSNPIQSRNPSLSLSSGVRTRIRSRIMRAYLQ
jgi:hypothetical protein